MHITGRLFQLFPIGYQRINTGQLFKSYKLIMLQTTTHTLEYIAKKDSTEKKDST